MEPGAGRALLPSTPSITEVVFFSWTCRVKSNDLSRVGPEPLLLCNCCSRDTGCALSRPLVKFGSGRLFPLRVPCVRCVCVISWGPTCTNCWIPPSHSPSKEPGPCAFCTFPGGRRPRSCPGDTRLGPRCAAACSGEWDSPHLPVPIAIFLTGFFPTCTSGYCGTTAGGGCGAAPCHSAAPRLVPVPLSSCGKPGPQKCFMFL